MTSGESKCDITWCRNVKNLQPSKQCARCERWHTAYRSTCSLSKQFIKPVVLWQCKDSFGGNSTGARWHVAWHSWQCVHMKIHAHKLSMKMSFHSVSCTSVSWKIMNIPYIKIVICFSEYLVYLLNRAPAMAHKSTSYLKSTCLYI